MPARAVWKVSINPREFPMKGIWPILREHGLLAIGWGNDSASARVKDVRDFHSIKSGDIILAYGGNHTVKAIGVAQDTPRIFAEGSRMSNLLGNALCRIGRVDWLIVRDFGTRGLPVPSSRVRGLSWNDTVHRLTPEQWERTKAHLGVNW